MSEIIFILVVVYVAYVIYSTVYDKSPVSNSESHTQPESKSVAQAEIPPQEPYQPVKQASPAATKVTTPASDELFNPKTGEVSKVPNNYRFGKRWIKDALVTEGLLDKVYKNSELDDATNEKVQAALADLRKMPKYQVK